MLTVYHQQGHGVPDIAMQMGLVIAASLLNHDELNFTGDENLVLSRGRSASGRSFVGVETEENHHRRQRYEAWRDRHAQAQAQAQAQAHAEHEESR